MKKLFLETLGCAMNSRDSEHIVAQLNQKEPYQLTTQLDEADLIIINTCSVREKPVSKLFSEIGIFNKNRKKGAKIGVCGCTASHLGKEIIKRAPVVDFVLGARNVSKINQVVDKHHAVEIDINYDESQFQFSEYRNNPLKAMVNISIGCDKKCTFCIVPSTRGEEISIPKDIILNEIQKVVDNGAKEVMLLGQNVNNYGRRFTNNNNSRYNFTMLLQDISKINGLKRIRFTSPHPLHMDDEFLEEFVSNPKICKQIHIPLQSGSTKILKEMKRGYTKEWFLNRCNKIREMLPNVAISTDIIVGFPNETDEDFNDTLDVLEKVRFEQLFSFRYSPRPMTPAKDYKNQVEAEIALERLKYLQKRHIEILDEIMESQMNKEIEVYFDELKANHQISGRSDEGRLVFLNGSEDILGTIRRVKVTKVSRTSLSGELIK
jgi:tRNA-2-methylthio-N6-dimethylallyladenosine synthase